MSPILLLQICVKSLFYKKLDLFLTKYQQESIVGSESCIQNHALESIELSQYFQLFFYTKYHYPGK